MDVTQCEAHQGSATRIAQAIKAAVKAELQITVSAGVAPNKFLAKVASDWQKPDGLFVITPEQVTDFVKALPVNKINGVGKVDNTAWAGNGDGVLAFDKDGNGKFGEDGTELFGINTATNFDRDDDDREKGQHGS